MEKPADGSAEPSFPEIEHERYVIPGNPTERLRRIIVEERGLRSFVFREYADPLVTAGEALIKVDFSSRCVQ